MNSDIIVKYLQILDRTEVRSKEHFMITCAVEGLEINDIVYSEVIKYEIEQLKRIQKNRAYVRRLPRTIIV